jgi:hypothetical protein
MSFDAECGHSLLLDVSIGDRVLMVSLFKRLVMSVQRITNITPVGYHVLHTVLPVEYGEYLLSKKLI